MNVRASRLIAAAVFFAASSSGVLAANPPGVTIDGGASINGWIFSPLYQATVFSGSSTQTNVQSNSSQDLGLLPAYLSGLTPGSTYTVSLTAQGTGFFDVYSDAVGADGDAFLNVSGNEDSSTFTAVIAGTNALYRTGLDLASEVFRVNSVQAKQYAISFVANAPTATFYFKSEKLEGGLTVLAASAVPEPESYAMMLAGLGAMGLMARRRRMK